MHTGMLWFSNDANKPLETKIKEAVDYYKNKYGEVPDTCLVHPSMLIGDGRINASFVLDNWTDIGGSKLTVRPYRPVLPSHIWIGIEDK